MFLKTEVFQMGMFHKLGYFGAHVQKPKEDDITWDLKHMTRTMEQLGSMAPKTYTYNGGLLRGITSHSHKNTICTWNFAPSARIYICSRLSHFVIPISWNFFILHLAMCFMMGKALGQMRDP
jgi:hypothetical protein